MKWWHFKENLICSKTIRGITESASLLPNAKLLFYQSCSVTIIIVVDSLTKKKNTFQISTDLFLFVKNFLLSLILRYNKLQVDEDIWHTPEKTSAISFCLLILAECIFSFW